MMRERQQEKPKTKITARPTSASIENETGCVVKKHVVFEKKCAIHKCPPLNSFAFVAHKKNSKLNLLN